MIYLDNAATTKLKQECLDVINYYSTVEFFNPSASYPCAVKVKTEINKAREIVGNAINGKSNILFCGSATECNNLAILSSVKSNSKKAIFSSGEHDSVYMVAESLKQKGLEVCYVKLKADGSVDVNHLISLLDDDVCLVSLFHISNETGAINNVQEICSLIRQKCKRAKIHIDGSQALSKLKIDVNLFDVDFYTMAAHKICGPKGVGALYYKNKDFLKPQILGGGQESNFRSGTENVAGILSFACAVKNIGNIVENKNYVENLKNVFLQNITCEHKINSTKNCSPYVVSLSFCGVFGETLVNSCAEMGVIISTGSACSAKKVGNRTLKAMGLEEDAISSAIRVSFCNDNTQDEVIEAANIISACALKLREKLK